jgi:NAD(P)-dependent dehydrogenase (short-subunit alcohol dehydrogenase family)
VTSRITTPYSAQTTADDIVDGLDLTGRRIIVTGGAAGIGIETASSLAAAGAEITLAVRNAVSPLLDGIGGKYFEDCNEALPNEPGTRRGVAAHALDPDAASRLWQVSQQTVGA